MVRATGMKSQRVKRARARRGGAVRKGDGEGRATGKGRFGEATVKAERTGKDRFGKATVKAERQGRV
eukprot:4202019-Pleurochrysis_carterae.AAC.1